MTRPVTQRTLRPARDGQERSSSAPKQPPVDLDRVVWDPEYRAAVRLELKSAPHAP